MADRLTVQVKLDTTQAKKNLADLISQMKKAEESGAKFKKSLSTSANVVGDLSKVDKAISGISQESNRADTSIKKLKGSADSLGSSFERVGSKFAKAFGSNLQSSLSKSIGFMKQLASTALMVGGAVSGVSAYKTFNDYTEFSKKAGSINAIVGGDASTQRLIENTMFGATAGTTQKSGDVGDALLSFASTPMFDPSAGGTLDKSSAEFKKNIAALGPIAKKVGAFASSQGTTLKTVMDGMILLSASEGFNLKDNKKGGGLDQAMDMMNALSNVSVGDPGSIMANVSKFAGAAHANKVDMKTAMAMYASLTNTFTAEEAAVRTNSVMNWAMKANKTTGRLTDIDPKIAAQFDALVYKKGPDGKEYKNDITSIIAGAGKIIDSITDVRKRDEVTSSMGNEVRTGQGLQGVQSSVISGLFGKSLNMMNGSEGIAARSIESFNQSSGAKISMFFNGMESGLQATTGALIDLFSSPEKFNVQSWEEAMNGIGDALKQNLGEGAAKPIEWLKNLVSYLNSDAGKQFTKNLTDSAVKLAGVIESIGKAVFSIVTSEAAQKFMDFVANNPILSLSVAMVGLPILQATLTTLFTTAISSAFLSGGVSAAIGKVMVGTGVASGVAGAAGGAAGGIATGVAAGALGGGAATIAGGTSTFTTGLVADGAAVAAGIGASTVGAIMAGVLGLSAITVRSQGEMLDAHNQVLTDSIVAAIKSSNSGISTQQAIAGAQNAVNKTKDIRSDTMSKRDLALDYYNNPQKYDKPMSPVNNGGDNIFARSIDALKTSFGIQDKKVGDGADKMSKAASDLASPTSMMIQAAAALSSAAAHLGSLQISGTSGGGGSPTAGNSANKSGIKDAASAFGRLLGM